MTKVKGDYVWHKHDNTDEFFLVVDGTMDIRLRDGDGEHGVTLNRGDVFVVPKQMEHCPASPGGASIVVIEPAGQPTTGDGTEDIPAHLRTTTGPTAAVIGFAGLDGSDTTARTWRRS